MNGPELFPRVVARFGPVEVTSTVVASLLVSAILIGAALASSPRCQMSVHDSSGE